MKKRHLWMLAGLAGAAWLAIFGDKSANMGSAEPVARRSALSASFSAAPSTPAGGGVNRSSTPIEAKSQTDQGEADVRIVALQPRADLAGDSSGGHGGDRFFSSKSWTPPPVSAKPEPPPPPTAPPLPFTYLGKQTVGGRMAVFLASGDEVIVARDQAVIRNTYRVESIRPATLSLIYLPLNQIQQLSIGVTN